MAPSSKYFRIHPTTSHQLYPSPQDSQEPPCVLRPPLWPLQSWLQRDIYKTQGQPPPLPAQDPPLVPSGLQAHKMTASGPWVVICTWTCTDRCRPASAPAPWPDLFTAPTGLRSTSSVSALHSVFPLEEKPHAGRILPLPSTRSRVWHSIWHGEKFIKYLLKE